MKANSDRYAYEALVDGEFQKSCIQSLVSSAISTHHAGTRRSTIRAAGTKVGNVFADMVRA